MEVEKEEVSKLEIEEQNLLLRLYKVINELLDYALTRITEYMSEVLGEELTKDEALGILDTHPELLNPKYLDEAIARTPKAAFVMGLAVSAVSSIIRQDKKWMRELQENGDKLVLQIVITYRPDLYELLKGKPNLTRFLISYILHKFKIR